MSISIADLEKRIEPRNFGRRTRDLFFYAAILYGREYGTLPEVWKENQETLNVFDQRLEKLTLFQRVFLYWKIKEMAEVTGSPDNEYCYKIAEFFLKNYLLVNK